MTVTEPKGGQGKKEEQGQQKSEDDKWRVVKVKPLAAKASQSQTETRNQIMSFIPEAMHVLDMHAI